MRIRMIQVAVMGYGTVGSGVVEVIEKNNAQVSRQAGDEIHVKYILDLREFPGDPYSERIVHDVNIIMEDAEVSIVCEAMGGVGAAYQFTKRALAAGKSVCTSNKELVAKHGTELLKLAAENHCSYLFEASVGGGIPIIRPLRTALTAEKILEVTGIVNGTTNYILTKMQREGADYETVLKQAQKLGYAEQDPTADVEGYDARRKLAILLSLTSGKSVDSEKIYTEGITKLTAADFEYALEAGMSIKLLASGRIGEDGSIVAMVAPFLIGKEQPLAMVNDVFNAILVTGNMAGELMFYGKGAGKLPTASAVVSDVIECAQNPGRTIQMMWDKEAVQLTDIAEVKCAFFLRVSATALEMTRKVFGSGEILKVKGREDEFGYLTRSMPEKEFRKKCGKLGDAVLGTIRVS